MSRLEQLKEGLGQAWENLAEGWHRLRERAGQALTRFQPRLRGGELETRDEQFLQLVPQWGLLPAEIHESSDEVKVRLEVPGMEADQFDVSVLDGYLLVRGEKRHQREQQEGRYHLLECAYGSFERAIPLPAEVDDSKARARYRRGILTVTLPKTATSRSRRITIES
ncbi:Hsp20/alpha crystallin family protein [Thiohalobacter sp. IOR34]|uniref:Hsp20/alpha crystallin family protein n=1 Tax=Thiohalobacter sp. IOR34 TaxID=3057176 RepID=UPI0025B21B20|nr:Hsp20/alpha crystallin family protein [Thiohalobacter sp. IOR34]WJW75818.1 Hsp20/alpha crystallin family protein [Thiohalobacter sp. IOR34]